MIQRSAARPLPRLLLVIFLLGTAIAIVACNEEVAIKYTDQRMLHAGQYQLLATHHMFPNLGGMGGGITHINGQWLLVSGDGDFHLFQRTRSGDDFRIQQLPYRAPMNRDRFRETAPLDRKREDTLVKRFRVADVVSSQSDGKLQLWISHHWWNEEESCVTLRVSTAVWAMEAFLAGAQPVLDWSTLYEVTPCLNIRESGFSGHEAGGKMALAGNPADALFLTVGSHGHDGIHSRPALAQDPGAAWGKVMKIDLPGGAATVYTSGHRTAQGLFIDDLGRMWLTEHGPRGGDELNLLEQGKNYGWPLVTYGTEYDTYDPWPLSANPGRHDGFELPVYAWVPSIGVSDVIRLQGDLFPQWKGDILAGSLREQALYRVHFQEGRAILVERIWVGKRIRDMSESPDGEIVLWTDNHRIIFIEPVTNPEYSD